ncbi:MULTISPECIES: peptidoglycan-binding protein [unclassified Crossiella]|uniref:peptidoglycan-binding protein n=1 Tax=unclassified Crossiella TaxID=2620835 RepID=UPI0024940A3E|nr:MULTISPECIES: peptidoglycan-binding protein [unclassified Crossiella]
MPDINGFTVSPDRNAIGIRTYTVPGTSVALPVRSEIAPLLIGAAAEWHRDVEPLTPGWCWGYAYRNVVGGSTPSFHSAGIAIDLNAPKHPLGRVGTVSAAQASRIRAIARKYGLRWGGDYSGRRDEMHLEVILTRSAALALVDRIQGGHPPPAGGRRILREGVRGDDVRLVQTRLGVAPDGIFGPKTAEAVRGFQRARGLVADGIVGPKTWAELDRAQEGPPPQDRPLLKLGARGQAVTYLQQILNRWYPGMDRLAEDGIYGPATANRVRFMQGRANLAVDGITGPATWRYLHGG